MASLSRPPPPPTLHRPPSPPPALVAPPRPSRHLGSPARALSPRPRARLARPPATRSRRVIVPVVASCGAGDRLASALSRSDPAARARRSSPPALSPPPPPPGRRAGPVARQRRSVVMTDPAPSSSSHPEGCVAFDRARRARAGRRRPRRGDRAALPRLISGARDPHLCSLPCLSPLAPRDGAATRRRTSRSRFWSARRAQTVSSSMTCVRAGARGGAPGDPAPRGSVSSGPRRALTRARRAIRCPRRVLCAALGPGCGMLASDASRRVRS